MSYRNLFVVTLVIAATTACGGLGYDPESPASIELSVEPAVAVVMIDGLALRSTVYGEETRFSLVPGAYRLEVEADGYETHRRDLILAGGERLRLDVELWPELDARP